VLLLLGAEQCMRALAKAEENRLESALQHNGTVQGVTKSPQRSTQQLTVFADVSSSVVETMLTATHSYPGLFPCTTIASAIPSAVFPWRCCAGLELAAA
jgi:hypothetical protein